MQKYTSANTSINKTKLPAIYNKINWEKLRSLNKILDINTLNILDIGAGKYTQHIKEFCESKGFNYYAYDKYNNSSTAGWNKITPTLVICSNVLNVIDDIDVIKKLHKWIKNKKVPYLITVYEGDKTGLGKKTKDDCYQRNEKIICYKEKDEVIYKNVLTKNDYVCYIK